MTNSLTVVTAICDCGQVTRRHAALKSNEVGISKIALVVRQLS